MCGVEKHTKGMVCHIICIAMRIRGAENLDRYCFGFIAQFVRKIVAAIAHGATEVVLLLGLIFLSGVLKCAGCSESFSGNVESCVGSVVLGRALLGALFFLFFRNAFCYFSKYADELKNKVKKISILMVLW